MRFALIAAALAVSLARPCDAKPLTYRLPEETAGLRPGPNLEAAQNNCVACHSVDYILTQPPKMGRMFWAREVDKMIHAYHAPIDDADARKIVDYLSEAY